MPSQMKGGRPSPPKKVTSKVPQAFRERMTAGLDRRGAEDGKVYPKSGEPATSDRRIQSKVGTKIGEKVNPLEQRVAKQRAVGNGQRRDKRPAGRPW